MALEDRWRKALPAEAKGDFHYTDFWNDPKHYAAKWTQEKRLEHIATLATIAHDCTAFGVGFVFSKTSYDELIPPKNKKALISPLHFCLAQCIVGILDFYKTIPSPPPPPLRFMFDRKEGQRNHLEMSIIMSGNYSTKTISWETSVLATENMNARFRLPTFLSVN